MGQRLEELLGVQRRHDHPAVDLHVRLPRYDPPQVDDELTRRMDDIREVDVLPLRDLVVQDDADSRRFFHDVLSGVRRVESERPVFSVSY